MKTCPGCGLIIGEEGVLPCDKCFICMECLERNLLKPDDLPNTRLCDLCFAFVAIEKDEEDD